MKPLAVVYGSSSSIAKALIEKMNDQYRVIGVSRSGEECGAAEGQFSSDFSEQSLADITAEIAEDSGPIELAVCAVGLLHSDSVNPEKRLADITASGLSSYFHVNSIIPALILKELAACMDRQKPCRMVFLSAKIGGIGDNRLGGWYGYRSSKAALNMLVKTAAVEFSRSSRKACAVVMHPGTTDTPLSEPFTGNVSEDKLYSPATTAGRLFEVIEQLGPDDSGRFLNWDGTDLPW